MENRPVRVFWYCEKWQAGGIQAVQMNLMKHIDPADVRFDIAVSEDDTDLFDARLAECGARKLVSLDRRYDGPGRRTLHNILAVRRLIREGKYDAVHFNVCHGVEMIYLFWAWLHRVPMRIVHCRNNDIGAGGRMRPVKIMAHHVCRRLFGGCANVRLANSDLAARWLFGRGHAEILKNGVEAQRFAYSEEGRREMRKTLGLEGKFVVGHVGHFNYQKNHEFLLEIFREIAACRPDARLLLVGEGERSQEMRARADEMGLSDQVIFFGVSEEVHRLMWAMDAFVLPSRFEGFGNVLAEAQAAGLACFASAGVIPGSVKLTENLRWMELKEEPAVWAEAVLSAEGLRRRDRSGDIVRAGYDIAAMARRLAAIYRGDI